MNNTHLRRHPAILAAWTDVGPVPQQGGQNIYLAVAESHFAELYKERRNLAQQLLPDAHVYDLDTPSPSLWALAPSGAALYLALETWGQVPQYTRYSPTLLFDKTGRVRERWQWHRPQERRPFPAMTAAASQAWFALWAIAVSQDPVVQAWYFAQATQRVIEFLSLSAGYQVTAALSLGVLRDIPHLSQAFSEPSSIPDRALRLLRLLSREMRRVASELGWDAPYPLEAAAYAAWNLPRPTPP